MAIVRVKGGTLDTGTAASITYLWTTDEEDVLIIAIGLATTTVTVDSVKYGGVDMTKRQEASQGTSVKLSVWTLDNPAVGSANVVVTLSGSSEYWINGQGYKGSDGYASGAVANGNSTAPAVTLNAADGHLMTDFVAILDASKTITSTVGAGQTELLTLAYGTTIGGCVSQKMATVSDNMSWTLSASAPWVHAVIEMAHTPLAGTATFASGTATLAAAGSVTAGFGESETVEISTSESEEIET